MEDIGVPLMSEPLAEALLSARVNTLELFPALLQNSDSNEEFPYRVYNIKTYLSRENLAESNVLMARLEEEISVVVVHEINESGD